jgi:hypothetical protein
MNITITSTDYADKAWARIKRDRETAMAARAISSAGIAYAITQDKANLADRLASLQSAIALGLAPADATVLWRDLDNAEHPLTQDGLRLLAAEMGMRGQAILEHSWGLEQQVRAAASADALDAIAWEPTPPILKDTHG